MRNGGEYMFVILWANNGKIHEISCVAKRVVFKTNFHIEIHNPHSTNKLNESG